MPKDNLKAKFGFNRILLNILIDTLNTLIKRAESGETSYSMNGICSHWESLLPRRFQETETPGLGYISITYSLVSELSADWPGSKTPGKRSAWPVPTDFNYQTWQGPNLAARLSLMRYIAHRLRDWRRRTPA